MAEKPIASARANVYEVSPETSKWAKVSDSPSSIGFYHHSEKGTYRIIGYAGSKPNLRVILKSFIIKVRNRFCAVLGWVGLYWTGLG